MSYRLLIAVSLIVALAPLASAAELTTPGTWHADWRLDAGGKQMQGGVAPPPVGQPMPPPSRRVAPPPGGSQPPPPPPPGSGAYGPVPDAGAAYYNPLILMCSLRVSLGVELFNDQPGLEGPTTFAWGIGVEAGVGFRAGIFRFVFVPFTAEFVNSNFFYKDPDSGETRTKDIGGSRLTFGFLIGIGPMEVAFRYGDRDYWTNPKVGSTNESLIGNDYNRDIFDLELHFALLPDQVGGQATIGTILEFPIDSRASNFAFLFVFSFRAST